MNHFDTAAAGGARSRGSGADNINSLSIRSDNFLSLWMTRRVGKPQRTQDFWMRGTAPMIGMKFVSGIRGAGKRVYSKAEYRSRIPYEGSDG